MSYPERYFLFTFGPTGSGKSKLRQIVSNYFCIKYKDNSSHYNKTGQLLKQTSVEILIDDLVEKHLHYKVEVNKILPSKSPEPEVRTRQEIADNPTPEEREAFEKAYWTTRKLIDCEQDRHQATLECSFADDTKPFLGPMSGCKVTTCDKKSDSELFNALQENENITFESQGNSSVQWILNSVYEQDRDELESRQKNSPMSRKFIFVYSYVAICTLIDRILRRAKDSIINFDVGQEYAPRLPNIREILLKIEEISKYLQEDIRKVDPYSHQTRIFVNMLKTIEDLSRKGYQCYLVIVDNTEPLSPKDREG